jgi:hypothetical protein
MIYIIVHGIEHPTRSAILRYAFPPSECEAALPSPGAGRRAL